MLVLTNALDELTAEQTTASLIAECATRTPTWVADPRGLRHLSQAIHVAALPVAGGDAASVVSRLGDRPEVLDVTQFDAVWVRLNPGRMSATGMVGVLETLVQLEEAGVRVRNGGLGLLRATSKLYLCTLPSDVVAPTWASRDPAYLQEAIAALDGPAVVKPAIGTRGSGVHRVTAEQSGLPDLLTDLCRAGPVLVQAYVPEAPDGDMRIQLVDGRLLEVHDQVAAVRRRPSRGEWRSNVALGGTPERGVVTEAHRALVGHVGPILASHGLWHVGLDVVGTRIVEVNVFSPGGLPDASRFTGVPFERHVVDAFLADGTTG